jgi:hypothetical protein
MWGLLEKGKELAANIDKQLNESVGVDGVPISSSATPSATASTDDGGLNDAWNDDFDDDAFDTSPAPVPTKTVSEPPIAPPILEEEEEVATAWQDDVNFDDSIPYVSQNSDVPPPPIEVTESLIAAQLDSPAVPDEPAPVEEVVAEEEEPPPAVVEPEPEPVQDPIQEPLDYSPSEPVVLEPQEEDQDSPVVVEAPEEIPSKDSSPVVVEQQPRAGWEEDLYDDDDDDDDDDSPEPEQPAKLETSKDLPESISIPSNNVDDEIPTNNNNSAVTSAMQQEQNEAYELQLATLKSQLYQMTGTLEQRESQISQKAEQMASMQAMYASEQEALQTKLRETKEEAKRRIQMAKERVASMESTLKASGKASEDAMAKEETINALREEGQKLAMKQSSMEKAVRAAKGETRELTHRLEEEQGKLEKAEDTIATLEAEWKKSKDELAAARRGESQASKLENNLVALQEEADKKEKANMSLQQQVKELKAESKELRKQMESVQKGAMLDSKRESHKLKKEHGDLVEELEIKLRASDREASVREDALRTEVSELRKRWQDTVRRADALSMDVQNSTAPLLRQLESMERQNRARAVAWADLETKLRTDLEDHVIDNEKLTKERNEYKSNHSRLTRISKDRDEELALAKTMVEEMRAKIEKQEAQIEEMETEGRNMKEEWSEVERLANEGVSKVRSDLMRTVLENEERYQMSQKSIDSELKEERKKRSLLERQVSELLDNAGMMVALAPSSNAANAPVVPKSVQKKLRSAESQGDILDRALVGLGDGEDGEDATDTLELDEDGFEEVETRPPNTGGGMSSFAAMEQLSSRLKEAKVELEALRQSLASSERVRASLVEELTETRVAKEKLPLFEAKVQELAIENREKQMEIMSLTEDVAEIRQLYRGQLNTLIEEKAASMSETPQRPRVPLGSGDNFMTPMQSSTPTTNVRIDDDSEDEEEDDDDAMHTPMQDGASSNGGETPSPGMTSPMMVRNSSGAPLDPSKKD